MNIAKYKKGLISVAEYDSKIHFGNISCPDCGRVKMKVIRKANQGSYFAFARDGGSHDKLCPRFTRPLDEDFIRKLMSTDSKRDMSRLNFLVNANLERPINLLTKLENDGELKDEDKLSLMPRKRQQMEEKRIREYTKQNIKSVNAADLSAHAEELRGQYVVVFGVAGITAEDINSSKKLTFKANKDSRFSIFVAPKQVQYLTFEGGTRAKFAVFGRVKISDNGRFINIEIKSTRDLVIKE